MISLRLVVVLMPLKIDIPLYARVVNTLQERMSDGTYPQGSMLPTENALIDEFGVSRQVVVRALAILRQDGWIDSAQGKGRFVRRTQPATAGTGAGRDVLRGERSAGVRLLRVGVVEAPMRAAYALGVQEGSPVVARRRLVSAPNGPIELSTVYLPVELAETTEAAEPRPLGVPIVEYLAERARVAWSHATDRIGARLPTAEEARTLEISRRDVVLTILVTAYDTTGVARLAADAVMPTVRAELEDTFPLS